MTLKSQLIANKKYYYKNQVYLLEQKKKYYLENREFILKQRKNDKKNFPWLLVLKGIKARCNNSNDVNYRNYGERGIKNYLTKEEIKEIWFRDKAYNLKKPTIDRINNDGDYEIRNCRFIELKDNVSERNKRVSSKKILQFDLKGNFIKEYSSVIEASKKTNIDASDIGKVARKLKHHAGTYIWKYKEN